MLKELSRQALLGYSVQHSLQPSSFKTTPTLNDTRARAYSERQKKIFQNQLLPNPPGTRNLTPNSHQRPVEVIIIKFLNVLLVLQNTDFRGAWRIVLNLLD